MAEQFKKTYVSVIEFIDSWEKEIYELTNLDYFSYLLINELASSIENDYFPKNNHDEQLNLNADEISTLSFNIADGLQGFFDKNCFGICKIGCPSKLDDVLDNEKRNCSMNFNLAIKDIIEDNQTKEQCLS